MQKRFLKIGALILVALLFSLFLYGCGERPVESLSGIMTAEELADLDQYEQLKTLDLSGSTCYEAIEDYIASHPDVDVTYTVNVAGTDYAPDVTEITLTGPDQIDSLLAAAPYLHKLSSVTVEGDGVSPEQLNALRSALPEAALKYSVSLGGKTLSPDTERLDLSSLKSGQVADAAQALALLPSLKEVILSDELPIDDFVLLKTAAPDANFSYSFDLFGQQVDMETTSLDYNQVEIGDEGLQTFEKLLPCLNKLQRVTFDRCGISDYAMDQLRSKFPDKEIVWKVYYGWGSSWSDAETIWAIGGFNDVQLSSLKYCTKVKYLDLGHNGITSLYFVYYMPDLEVLIIENDYVSDLTPLSSCKNIEYLEVGETRVKDVSPLANCNSLRHLNIGGLPKLTDISPLYGLTNLERLYGLCDVNVPAEQVEHITQLMPNTEVDFSYDPKGAVNGSHWRYYEGGLVPRYMLLHDQLGYDW